MVESKHLSSIITTPNLEEMDSIISLFTAGQVMRIQRENAGSTDAPQPAAAPTEEAVVDVPWSRAVAGTHAEQASAKEQIDVGFLQQLMVFFEQMWDIVGLLLN